MKWAACYLFLKKNRSFFEETKFKLLLINHKRKYLYLINFHYISLYNLIQYPYITKLTWKHRVRCAPKLFLAMKHSNRSMSYFITHDLYYSSYIKLNFKIFQYYLPGDQKLIIVFLKLIFGIWKLAFAMLRDHLVWYNWKWIMAGDRYN